MELVSNYTYASDDDLLGINHLYPGATAPLTLTYSYSTAAQLLTAAISEALNRHSVAGALGTQSYASANPLNQYPSTTPIGGALTSIV